MSRLLFYPKAGKSKGTDLLIGALKPEFVELGVIHGNILADAELKDKSSLLITKYSWNMKYQWNMKLQCYPLGL